jgi:hypothetical protein
MAVQIEAPSFIVLSLDKIVSKLPVRRLSISGLKRIQDSMHKVGFLENYPIVVAPLEDGSYLLIDGNHRYESAKALGLETVPCLVKYGLPEDEMYRLAIQSNSASVTSVPMTLVAYAEFVWERSKEEKTQEKIAEILGWSRGKVGDYALLRNIATETWNIIVGTFENSAQSTPDDSPTQIVGTPTFTENLLRSILGLTPEQQLELVNDRVNDPKGFTPGKFKSRAQGFDSSFWHKSS